MKRPSTPWLLRALGWLALGLAHPGVAHDAGISSSHWGWTGATLQVEIGIAADELALLSDSADSDGDLRLSAAEFNRSRGELGDLLAASTSVMQDGRPCSVASARANWSAPRSVDLSLSFHCDASAEPSRVAVDLPWLARLGGEHRHWASHSRDGAEQRVLLSSMHTRFELGSGQVVGSTFALVLFGAEHIVLGADHLAFLLGLLLAGGRIRELVLNLTAFTVAHSVTLGLMLAGALNAPGAVIEPLIGFSVAAVAFANLRRWRPGGSWRWAMVLGFGLIHGFGFAGAVAEHAPPAQNLLPWLLAFNLGVELGQLAVVSALLGAAALLRRMQHAQRHSRRSAVALNALLLLIGVGWMLQRLPWS